jgi:hypothetical protein
MYICDMPCIWYRSITFHLFTLVQYRETVWGVLGLQFMHVHLFSLVCGAETPLMIHQHKGLITQMSELTNSQLCTRPDNSYAESLCSRVKTPAQFSESFWYQSRKCRTVFTNNFHQTLQTNTETVPGNRPQHLPSKFIKQTFQKHNSIHAVKSRRMRLTRLAAWMERRGTRIHWIDLAQESDQWRAPVNARTFGFHDEMMKISWLAVQLVVSRVVLSSMELAAICLKGCQQHGLQRCRK